MIETVLQQAAHHPNKLLLIFSHLGAIGLFFLAIVDSTLIPTFSGPDILIAILVVARHHPWYEYPPVATIGSTIGAYITYRLARKAGEAWLHSKFGQGRVAGFLRVFEKHGTGTLIATTVIPFPLPTTLVFAASGASGYRLSRFLATVAVCRAIRYTGLALLVDFYGRNFIHMFRHPTAYIGWFILLLVLVVLLIGGGILVQRRLTPSPAH